jgi:hypothetical protein
MEWNIYKDIVILERSFGQARNLQQAFKNEDIPFHVNSREGYFEQSIALKNDNTKRTSVCSKYPSRLLTWNGISSFLKACCYENRKL